MRAEALLSDDVFLFLTLLTIRGRGAGRRLPASAMLTPVLLPPGEDILRVTWPVIAQAAGATGEPQAPQTSPPILLTVEASGLTSSSFKMPMLLGGLSLIHTSV